MSVELVYEIGINHNGDMATAKKLIDVAHSAGCDYVKFQKRNIESVYTKEELDAPRESPWGATNREQKEGLEFGFDDYVELKRYCGDKIGWLASPWDLKSLYDLFLLKSKYIKIPSALITNEAFLANCLNYDAQVILSTGMSTMSMINRAVEVLGREKIYCIMACTSTYPTKPEELNLNFIKTLKKVYPWAKIGFSNHSPGVVYMAIAASLGAEMIEFHGTLDRSMYGSDQAASIEPEGVYKLSKWLKGIEVAMGTGIKEIYDSELPIMEKLRR